MAILIADKIDSVVTKKIELGVKVLDKSKINDQNILNLSDQAKNANKSCLANQILAKKNVEAIIKNNIL